ncbi:hypothetical protein ES705_43311 [subsurface metagenome]
MCRAKHLKPGWYQFITVLLWIFFEVSFFFIGLVLIGEGFGPYILGIAGATLGGIIAYQIARFAKPKYSAVEGTLDGEMIH